MLNLITALTNGTVEYKDNGEMITHPPSALMLRAARVLKEVATVNEANNAVINQFQARIQQLELENESLRQTQQQTGNVGSSDGQPELSNQDSPGDATPLSKSQC